MELHQVGQKQAAKMYMGAWWKDKTAKEIVDFQLFVLDLCVPYDKFHTALEQVLERQIDGEEFGTNYPLIAQCLHAAAMWPFVTINRAAQDAKKKFIRAKAIRTMREDGCAGKWPTAHKGAKNHDQTPERRTARVGL